MTATNGTPVQTNSSRFLIGFNSIEGCLRGITKEPKGTTFSSLIYKATGSNATIRHFSIDLQEFADLRNAIVHERTNSHVIAEPNDESVTLIEKIASILTAPPRVIPIFTRAVATADSSSSIADILRLMSKNSYSQVPIYEGSKFVALLTANTIVRWLGSCLEVNYICLSETLVSSVLGFAESKDNYYFIGRNSSVFEVLEQFDKFSNKGNILDAILITNDGKASSALLGIITVSDLPRIYNQIQIKR